jgi:hypothetical protein
MPEEPKEQTFQESLMIATKLAAALTKLEPRETLKGKKR